MSKAKINRRNERPNDYEMLKLMAERLMRLAGQLSDNGEPLNQEDVELIKFAHVPFIKEEFHMCMDSFMIGDEVDTSLLIDYFKIRL